MIGQTVSHYRILSQIGAGGMGIVFEAEDTRLGRRVALKFLPESSTRDELALERFRREAQAASALNHSSICTVYDIGDYDGRSFIVMERLNGRTLKEALEDPTNPSGSMETLTLGDPGEEEEAPGVPLEIEETLDLGIQLSDALEAAHAEGIVHRDIKPANIFIVDRGPAKLLDFGLAKLDPNRSAPPVLSDSSFDSGALTLVGDLVGTLYYMSPEQTRGELVDHRTDVFSLGSVLYEVATGQRPFVGRTAKEIAGRIRLDDPTPPNLLNRMIPMELEKVLSRAMQKDTRKRFQHAADLKAALTGLRRNLASAVYDRRSASPVPVAVVGPVAVIDFANLTDPDDSDSIARMMTNLLNTEVSNSVGLKVISRQRLFDVLKQTDSETLDRSVATEVALKAGAKLMVVGEAARIGERIVVTTELVQVADGELLGSQRVDGEGVEQLFELAVDLAEQLRGALQVNPTTGYRSSEDLVRELTGSIEAYRSYVRGEAFFQRVRFLSAAEQFQAATRIDPRFALGHFWLSWASKLAGQDLQAAVSAEKAAELSEQLPLPYQVMVKANACVMTGAWAKAIQMYEAIYEKDPTNKAVLQSLAFVYLYSSRDCDPARAAFMYDLALIQDPNSLATYNDLAMSYALRGKFEAAEERLDRMESVAPTDVQMMRVAMAALEGRFEEGWSLSSTIDEDYRSRWQGRLAMLTSRWDEAREITAREMGHGYRRALLVRARGDFFVYRGEFDDALAAYTEAALEPERGGDGVFSGAASSARQSLAQLHVFRGDAGQALVEAERALELFPESFRSLFFCGVMAVAAGEPKIARRYLASITRLLTQSRSLGARIYRDALAGEISLANGAPEEAASLFGQVVGSNRLMEDFLSTHSSIGAVFREGLGRSYLEMSEPEQAARAFEGLLASGMERINAPIAYVKTLYTLGKVKLKAGDVAGGRELLDQYLDHWGNADWNVPEIELARSARAD